MSDTIHFLLSNEFIKIKGAPADLCTLLFNADSIFSGREWNKILVFLSILIISTDHFPSSCFIFADVVEKAVLHPWKVWVSVGELHNSECSWLCISQSSPGPIWSTVLFFPATGFGAQVYVCSSLLYLYLCSLCHVTFPKLAARRFLIKKSLLRKWIIILKIQTCQHDIV